MCFVDSQRITALLTLPTVVVEVGGSMLALGARSMLNGDDLQEVGKTLFGGHGKVPTGN